MGGGARVGEGVLMGEGRRQRRPTPRWGESSCEERGSGGATPPPPPQHVAEGGQEPRLPTRLAVGSLPGAPPTVTAAAATTVTATAA